MEKTTRRPAETLAPTLAAEDAAAMARLHAAAFPDEPWDAATLTAMAGDPGCRTLALRNDDGAPTGFILIRTAADEAEILTVCVDPAMRRRGGGAALLDAARRAAADDGATQLFLEVAADNAAATALYAGAGFAVVGRRRGYYRRGDGKVDAVVMRRSL